MRLHAARWLAWFMLALAVAQLPLVRLILALPHERPLMIETEGSSPFAFTGLLAFSAVGALIVSRRPAHPIGWIFCWTGLLVALAASTGAYDQYDRAVPGVLPAGEVVGPLSGLFFYGGFGLPTTLGLLLFPDGRLPSPRWRPVLWLVPLSLACVILEDALASGPARGMADVLGGAGLLTFVAGVLASAGSLVLRWRRAREAERQQLKWVGAAAAAVGLTIPAEIAGTLAWPDFAASGLAFLLYTLAFSLIPVAAGVAILRYRLYDIDLVINRTLVYGTLTVSLGLLYFGGVVVLQGLFRTLTGQGSDLAIVGSTLAIAALFQPLRRRLQGTVDRLFYRRKYDAAKTLAAFGATLRDEVDLARLTEELLGVVQETMQPAHVSLWLRQDAGRGRGAAQPGPGGGR